MLPIKIALPQDFLNEEVRYGYTVTHEMKEVWAVLIDLLIEFSRVCEKHNIRWFADAGTILGAVRHKGMIPWDDDIDVMMLREEYDKFCKECSSEFKHPYFFQTEYTDPGCIRGHVQIRNSETTGILNVELKEKYKFNQGIFLDIFPIEDLPIDETQLTKYTNRLNSLKSEVFHERYMVHTYQVAFQKNIFKLIKSTIEHIYLKYINQYHYRKTYDLFERELTIYKGSESKKVAKLALTPFKTRRLWDRQWLSSSIMLPFEFIQIPVPIGYIELLNTFYSDWNKYVMGASTHGGVLFDTHSSYKKYIR